jgi:hypothetical protein
MIFPFTLIMANQKSRHIVYFYTMHHVILTEQCWCANRNMIPLPPPPPPTSFFIPLMDLGNKVLATWNKLYLTEDGTLHSHSSGKSYPTKLCIVKISLYHCNIVIILTKTSMYCSLYWLYKTHVREICCL